MYVYPCLFTQNHVPYTIFFNAEILEIYKEFSLEKSNIIRSIILTTKDNGGSIQHIGSTIYKALYHSIYLINIYLYVVYVYVGRNLS